MVRPHQVLHHEASHLVVLEVPQQLIFARSLSNSSYTSSWELQVELKHVWVNALANGQLSALIIPNTLGSITSFNNQQGLNAATAQFFFCVVQQMGFTSTYRHTHIAYLETNPYILDCSTPLHLNYAWPCHLWFPCLSPHSPQIHGERCGSWKNPTIPWYVMSLV